ncbi:DUF7018 domain-containing (lipo)protein [Bacillus sp. B-jedd]|uniref:DUF7018 domain-containing (lipo)protein n=1 Tax=Bacillus sp. B-jedd TaxID=1476857 RepID=UPI0005155458|nr:DUF3994 domain-containing protein [Bacillus sp. B-jedd]CEG26461.1 hypothetical protein BN1002_01308 [Bacillus sp. B-jedd]
MKGKLLAVGLLAVGILTACNTSEAGGKDTKPAKIEMVKVSKEDYPKKLYDLKDRLDAEFKSISEVGKQSPGKKRDNQILEHLDALQEVVIDYKSIEAPEEYKEVQALLVQSMTHFDKSIGTMKEAIKKKDSELWLSSADSTDKADELWIEGYKLLHDLEPIGDGTINRQMLKDLDKSAGIDRDAVEENISEDGKELVGKWGNEGSTPSIVLFADGRYEGYANDAYPSKDNAFLGTWKYDKSTHVITFTNDKKFDDGKEVKPMRATMTMEVQDFKDGKIYLRDLETLGEFRYVAIE